MENLKGSYITFVLPTQTPFKILLQNFKTSGILTDKKPSCRCTALTEETLDKVTAQMEHSPLKPPRQLAQQEHQDSLHEEQQNY
jgi:Zn-finger nucleic acid-binding protein